MASTIQISFRQVAVLATTVLVADGNQALVGWNLINPISTDAYLKIYNSATAAGVTVGTTTPIMTLLIPAGPGTFWQSNEDKFQMGFSLGIVIAVTTGIADSNTTAPGTGCYVQLFYNANV
ncbi:MAG: hypothetical protein AABY22_05865 [Nanoarchaeota archaeon]